MSGYVEIYKPMELRQMFRNLASLAQWFAGGKSDRLAFAVSATEQGYQRRVAYQHHPKQPGVEPTRFGDWEYNGRCTVFT